MSTPSVFPARSRSARSRRASPQSSAAVLPDDPAARRRILDVARGDFFAHGFHAITMADLARELGMSKKTLYRHFVSKEDLLDAILDDFADEIAGLMERVCSEPALSMPERLQRLLAGIGQHLAPIQPAFLVSLKRFAPAQWERLEQLRRRNLERHVAPMLAAGRARGEVRRAPETAFVVEVLLGMLQFLLDPATLSRLGLAPAQAVAQGLDILFHGFLQPPASGTDRS